MFRFTDRWQNSIGTLLHGAVQVKDQAQFDTMLGLLEGHDLALERAMPITGVVLELDLVSAMPVGAGSTGSIAWDTFTFDPINIPVSGSGPVLPAGMAGYYSIGGSLTATSGTPANTTIDVIVNHAVGAAVHYKSYAVGAGTNLSFGVPAVHLLDTDIIDVQVHNGGGGTVSYKGTFLMVRLPV